MTTSKPLDVLCFGEVIVDFFPERPGIALADAARFERHLGGAPANVAVGLARLGVASGLVTLVGKDAFGDFLREGLAAEGVDVRGVGRHPTAKTGVTFVAVGPRGERSFTFYREGCADQRVAPADVDPALVASSRVLHVGSSTLVHDDPRAATHAALAAARAAGALISMDPNLRLHLWADVATARAHTLEVLAQAHVLKLADDELEPLFGTRDPIAAAAAARALGPRFVVVTKGAAGAIYVAPTGPGSVAAEAVTPIDTTGAGDGFVAGMLATLLRALPARSAAAGLATLAPHVFERAVGNGHRVGARVVTRFGATAALPRASDLNLV